MNAEKPERLVSDMRNVRYGEVLTESRCAESPQSISVQFPSLGRTRKPKSTVA